MRDLRDILDEAAGAPPDLPDVQMIRRRARPVLIRRRAVAGLVCVCLAVAVGTGLVEIREALSPRGSTLVQPTPDPAPRALRQGQMEPGSYAGQVGPFDVALTLGTDDWSLVANHDTWLALVYRQYAVHVQVWGSVVPVDSRDALVKEAVPPDLVAWLEHNDRVTVTAARQVGVGGLPATEVVLRVARPLDRAPRECTTSRCVVLARIARVGELVHLEGDERARILVVGEAGEQVVVTYRAPEDEFAVLDEVARELLSGLRLTASG